MFTIHGHRLSALVHTYIHLISFSPKNITTVKTPYNSYCGFFLATTFTPAFAVLNV
jgi:hypothetical protein